MSVHIKTLLDSLKNIEKDIVIKTDVSEIKSSSCLLKARSSVLESDTKIIDFTNYGHQSVVCFIDYIESAKLPSDDNSNITMIEIHELADLYNVIPLNIYMTNILINITDTIIGSINILKYCKVDMILDKAIKKLEFKINVCGKWNENAILIFIKYIKTGDLLEHDSLKVWVDVYNLSILYNIYMLKKYTETILIEYTLDLNHSLELLEYCDSKDIIELALNTIYYNIKNNEADNIIRQVSDKVKLLVFDFITKSKR